MKFIKIAVNVNECYFCQEQDVSIEEVNQEFVYVFCPKCKAQGPRCDDAINAIIKWNEAGENTEKERRE